MTESEVFERLCQMFPAPAHTCLSQIRNTVGFSNRVGTADAIIVSTWPSRGIWIAGVEIKVRRSDWKRELKSPEKSEPIQRYCDRWYVAAPKGIVSVDEVPETWGLIEVVEKYADSSITKKAPTLTPRPIDLGFLCMILRGVEKANVLASLVDGLAEAKAAETVTAAVSQACHAMERKHRDLETAVENFEEHSGVSISDPWTAGEIGDAVRIVRDGKLTAAIHLSETLREQARAIARRLDEAIPRLQEIAAVGDKR